MPKTKPLQQPLLELIKQPPTYELVINPVSPEIALFDDAYHIVSIRKTGDEIVARYQIPGQWRSQEVSILYQQIHGVGWQLKEGDHFEGRPCQNDEIYEICEQFCRQIGGTI